MQMTLTIIAESPAEMATVLAALQGAGIGAPVELKAGGTPAAVPPANDAQPAPRRGRPPKVVEPVEAKTVEKPAAPVVEPPKVVEKAAPVPASRLKVVEKVEPPKEEAPEKPVTIMDVRRALTEFLQANDEPAAAALLAKFGKTDRLSKLDPANYKAVYDAAVTPPAKSNSGAPFDDALDEVGGTA